MPSFALDGKTVFVTGGTGTIGNRVVRELLRQGASVIVYSRDQNKQFVMNYDLSSARVEYKNGDVCDYELVRRSMVGADYVVHCAASKHVPLCERNVDSAIKVNINGTANVLRACAHNNISKFLLLSTDKSVYPRSVMGNTKFLAERLTLDYSTSVNASIVRLGNVFGSNGSVVPTFLDRIKFKLPLIVNSYHALRYFLTIKDAGEFIVNRLIDMKTGEIYVKKMKMMGIIDLAKAIVPANNYPIVKGKLTPGEVEVEHLMTEEECKFSHDNHEYWAINNEPSEVGYKGGTAEFFKHEEIVEMLKDIK